MATLFSLGSCSSTSQPLLQESDPPRVTNTTDYGESNGTSTVCGTLNGLESNVATTEPESVGTQFTLEGNDRVISSLLGIYVAESSVDYTINRIDRAIDLCLATVFGDASRACSAMSATVICTGPPSG